MSNIIETIRPTRNYTSEEEQGNWWYIKRIEKEWKYYRKYCGFDLRPIDINKEEFRTRRDCQRRKALRLRFENSNEIGAFMRLTNSYCIIPTGEELELFQGTIKGDFPEMPVVNTTIAGCRIIGRLCVGNSKGLLVPETINENEFKQIRSELPENVKLEIMEDRLSALGNVIVCNDNVALIHPELDKESEEIIADTLQVEVFRHLLSNNPLVGSYCVLTNLGGLFYPDIADNDLENIASLLQIPLSKGTINCGCNVLGAGLVANDRLAYAGMKTTLSEFSVIENVFNLKIPVL